MIQFEDVSLFGIKGNTIVKNVSFTVTEGEKCVLTGPSGCGKSTILKAVPAGIEKWEGTLSVDSTAVSPKTIHSLRRKVGMIPQEPRLPAGSVEEYLSHFCTIAGNGWDQKQKERAIDLLTTVQLSENVMIQDTQRLSGGERQRVAVVAVLLLERPIILADEITSALDAKSKKAVTELVLNSNATVLSVSHESEWVDRCSRTIDVTAFGKEL